MKAISTLAVLFMLAILHGCGGGGGGSGKAGGTDGEIKLMTRTNMPEGSTAGPYTVEVPEGSVSLTVIADGGDTSDMDISSLRDPMGKRLITDGYSDPIGRNFAQGPGQSVVSLTVPHSDGYELEPGSWSFDITHYASPGGARDVSIYTVVKRSLGNVINLNLWFVAIPDYTGDDDTNVAAIMSEAQRLFETAGIKAGDVKSFVLTGDDAERLTYIDIDTDTNSNDQPDDMDELFRFSSRADNDYVNIFFVRSIGRGVIGYSGGIPGPPLLQGTAHSGVVVTTFGGLSSMNWADLAMQGATIAHEAGHYLGLFHTTEQGGESFDPLSDTPECGRATHDRNGDGVVSALECRAADGPNLMFWAAAPYPQETVTGAQSLVMRKSPAVK